MRKELVVAGEEFISTMAGILGIKPGELGREMLGRKGFNLPLDGGILRISAKSPELKRAALKTRARGLLLHNPPRGLAGKRA